MSSDARRQVRLLDCLVLGSQLVTAFDASCRRCALCQQHFGSGFQENVGSSEVLRARRMLIERNAAPDGGGGVTAIALPLRQGIESFLDELTHNRALHGGQSSYQTPLDVCAFCTQFLPSTYRDPEADRKGEENRHIAIAQQRATRPSRPYTPHHSSLIIQHRLSARTSSSSASPKRVASRPSSKSPALAQSSSPAAPAFRLLSSDAARVLRIDAPALATSTTANTFDTSPPGGSSLLSSSAVLHDLGAQSRLESASILRDQQLAARSRLHMPSLRDANASNDREETRRARNIVLDNQSRAETLYTGAASVARSLLLGRPPSAATTASSASLFDRQELQRQVESLPMRSKERSRVVPSKHGRHWKTELRFPPASKHPS